MEGTTVKFTLVIFNVKKALKTQVDINSISKADIKWAELDINRSNSTKSQ